MEWRNTMTITTCGPWNLIRQAGTSRIGNNLERLVLDKSREPRYSVTAFTRKKADLDDPLTWAAGEMAKIAEAYESRVKSYQRTIELYTGYANDAKAAAEHFKDAKQG